MSSGHRTVVAVCQRCGILPVKVSADGSVDNATIIFGSGVRVGLSLVFPIFDLKPIAPSFK